MSASLNPVEGERALRLGGIMKMRLLFSALLAMVMIQFAPLAAWSHCWNDGYGWSGPGPRYGVNVTPWQARQIYRAERVGYYGPRPFPAYPAYGAYGYPPGYYHHGFVTNVARAIF